MSDVAIGLTKDSPVLDILENWLIKGDQSAPDDIVIDIVRAQRVKGLAKYAVPLDTSTPGDILRHAAEEAVDLAAYLMVVGLKESDENKKQEKANMVYGALRMVFKIAELIAERDGGQQVS